MPQAFFGPYYFGPTYFGPSYWGGTGTVVSTGPGAVGDYNGPQYWGVSYFGPSYFLNQQPGPLILGWNGLGLPFRRPSNRLLPNLVTITPSASWAHDPAGGRQPQVGVTRGPYRCAVQPTAAGETADHLRDGDVITGVAKFYSDPQVKVRDVINFGTRLLVVMGVRSTSGGQGRTWIINWEERPPKG